MTAYLNPRRAAALLAAGLAIGGLFASSSRADMYRMTLNSGGGIPSQATLGTPVATSTNWSINWYGLHGWYTVQGSADLVNWSGLASVAATDFAWGVTVPNPATNTTYNFRLFQANSFAGSSACGSCHGDKYTPYLATAHAGAFAVLGSSQSKSSCLLCHTVGYGQPGGFTNATLTANLENVGCESCHGAAGWHKDSDHALITPAVSIAPEICGSCHQGHNPQYNEYTNSLHDQVNDTIKYGVTGGAYYSNTVTLLVKGVSTTLYGYYLTTNAATGALVTNAATGIVNSSHVPGSSVDPGDDRQTSCGVCHSGAARMAMINDYQARLSGYTNALSLPSANDAGAWGPTCGVCHDPHSLNASPVFTYTTTIVAGVSTNTSMSPVMPHYLQLRNPTWSSNYFTMPSLSDKRYDSSGNPFYMSTTFGSLYDPTVNVCGQCHNTRGARWDGLAYGLLTNVIATTNVVISAAYTYSYTTNYNLYDQIVGITTNASPTGGRVTNYVAANVLAITAGLTTNITGQSRAPHNSPQYNILIGILQPDYLNSTNGKTFYTNSVLTNGIGIYATHSGIAARSIYNTNQCATCHVPSYSTAGGTVTGHTFDMDPNGCALGGCHTSGWPDYLGYQVTTTNNLARVADLLNAWATNYAPGILTTNYYKYQQNSWEYTSPGALASATNAGPSTADQLKLPVAIQQARFDAYMVRNDGSLGVQNPTFIPLLIKDAETKVLNQFVTAKFSLLGSGDIAPGGKVTFTNWNPNVTACAWNFGDGSAVTNTIATSVTHAYSNAGTYAVTLTATDGSGTQTLTRNNFVNVYTLPVASFSYTSGTLTHPVTVNFTNTSANAEYGKWSFYNAGTSMATTNRLSVTAGLTASFTYTNAGSYIVILQASGPASSANVTNTITVN